LHVLCIDGTNTIYKNMYCLTQVTQGDVTHTGISHCQFEHVIVTEIYNRMQN